MLNYIRRLERKAGRPIEMTLRYCVFLLLSCYYLLLILTLRIEEHGGEIPRDFRKNNVNFVVSTWHGRLLCIGLVVRRRLGGALIAFNSPHLDGKMLAWLHRWIGVKTIYGAPNKNPERGMVNLLKYAKHKPSDLLITPDGPRGPRQRVKRGVIAFSKLSGAPIIPVGFAAKKRGMLKSWDRFTLPMPFSTLITIWGEPIIIAKDADKDAQSDAQQLLEQRMNALLVQADEKAGHVAPQPASPQPEISD